MAGPWSRRRALLADYVGERNALLEEIERAWSRQTRRPKVREVDAWIARWPLTGWPHMGGLISVPA
jgi:hypothetical protein